MKGFSFGMLISIWLCVALSAFLGLPIPAFSWGVITGVSVSALLFLSIGGRK